MHPDQGWNLQPFGVWDNTPTNWATQTGLLFLFFINFNFFEFIDLTERGRDTHTHKHPRSVQKVSIHVIWKIETIVEEDTRNLYIGQWPLSPLQSRHLETSHSSPNFISCPIIFSWISLTVWNLLPFKGDFSFGKIQKSQGAKSGL